VQAAWPVVEPHAVLLMVYVMMAIRAQHLLVDHGTGRMLTWGFGQLCMLLLLWTS
jgi:hypothetical protein